MRNLFGRAPAALALVAAFRIISGCNDIDVYYQRAEPSPAVSADRPADRVDAVPDQLVVDAPDAPAPDDGQPPDATPDVFPDVPPDQAMVEDLPDGAPPDEGPSTDLPDDSDRPGMPDATVPDDVPDATPDASDAPDATVSDASPDHPAEDHADASSEDIPSPDGPDDVPDATGDVPADADAAPADATDVSDAPDAAPPPQLVITYATMRGPTLIPADQDASRIDYSFGDGFRRTCTATRLTAPLWRCTVSTVPPAALSALVLYFAIPGACGIDTGSSCDGWPTLWTVTWRGRTYDADTVITTGAGREPAFSLVGRSECNGGLGYNNFCVRMAVQP